MARIDLPGGIAPGRMALGMWRITDGDMPRARIRCAARAAEVDMDRQTWFELLEAARGHAVP